MTGGNYFPERLIFEKYIVHVFLASKMDEEILISSLSFLFQRNTMFFHPRRWASKEIAFRGFSFSLCHLISLDVLASLGKFDAKLIFETENIKI